MWLRHAYLSSLSLWLVLLALLQRPLACQPLVETTLGELVGESVRLENGDVIDTFLGVPFATPAIGELRFEVGTTNERVVKFLQSLPGTADDRYSINIDCF